jgi:FtsP/CotA-like multicopper oxidase with cupredoxin domain
MDGHPFQPVATGPLTATPSQCETEVGSTGTTRTHTVAQHARPGEGIGLLLDLRGLEVGEELVFFEGEQIYMFHCHILEHETTMMLNVKIADSRG